MKDAGKGLVSLALRRDIPVVLTTQKYLKLDSTFVYTDAYYKYKSDSF